MISAVIPNWNRPETLVKTILPILERYARISEIVISHGKKATAFDYKSRFCRIRHREDWELNKDWGLLCRFIAASEAVNKTIWHQDDDLLVPETTIEALFRHHRQHPDVLCGLHGRRCSNKLLYEAVEIHGDVLLLAGQAMLYKRRLAAQSFASEYQKIHDFMRNNVERHAAEDLLLSLVALQNSGAPNKSVNLPSVDLRYFCNNDEALERRPQHSLKRTEFLRYAVPAMQLQETFAAFEKNHPVPYHIEREMQAEQRAAATAKPVKSLKFRVFYLLLSRMPGAIARSLLHFWARKKWPEMTRQPPPALPAAPNAGE